MENLFSARSKRTARLLLVAMACGLTWACQDDFKYDDEKPSWLSTSIYEGLEARGNFSTYLQLLNDPVVNEEGVSSLRDVLSKTGSKTVFVANDEAWQNFFNHNATLPVTNPWHNATSYQNLSTSQKLLLIHTSMLNNAIVMENLASSDGNQQNSPTRGEFMRRYTDYVLTDTVTYLPPSELPFSYSTVDDDYWARFRVAGARENSNYVGAYLLNDDSRSMMLHFTSEHMTKHDVTDEDFKVFMGRERATSDVHIYDALLLDKDIVAENGYVNITERVIAPLANMAEVIRTNNQTNIFCHMMDRFSFPKYDADLTTFYNRLHPNEPIDSIFVKRYFSAHTVRPALTDPNGQTFKDGNTALKFDPGWNEYYDESDKRADMAAIFVPSDEALWTYFLEGGGSALIETYGDASITVEKYDYDALYRQIDAVPLSTLQSLLNVIMFRSFVGSVPSKMPKLRNDAQEEIFTVEDVNNIDTCYLASNGAVYVTKKVYAPADYSSVAAPAYISKTNLIMKWAIYNGSVESSDKMKINYYAYLKAMKSYFTLFLPSDEAMLRYYDPISFTSQKPRVMSLTYTGTSEEDVSKDTWNPTDKNAYKLYRYDPATATMGDAWTNEAMKEDDIINRLKDILESHTIVHDGTNPIDSENQYYITKNGSAIKVTRDGEGKIVKVQGGFQLENERANRLNGSRGTVEVKVEQTYDMQNGRTYIINDCPIIPPSKSVYEVLNTTTDQSGQLAFEEFFNLTQPSSEIIRACGLVSSNLTSEIQDRLEKKFFTFIDNGGVDFNVQFFNNYRYTVFVPTKAALDAAVANGLPTWETIEADYAAIPSFKSLAEKESDGITYKTVDGKYIVLNYYKDENNEEIKDTIWVSADKFEDEDLHCLLHSDSLRLQAEITYLNNFLRGHFLDNSIFVDKSDVASTDFVTSSYNTELGVFVKVHCRRANGKLYVRDDNGGTEIPVVDSDEQIFNIMARDVTCTRNNKATSPKGQNTMNNLQIQGSSFAVIHQIDGVLNHTSLDADGKYPDFKKMSVGECKRYLQKFAIQ
ncbi:MAG: hypothetical protein J5486_01835 [Bacteroidaceae bacterium]|nr:hypothetical protein [Bacteroidaceae bacterium]